jgi:ketosteroid isomerase-like protein
MSQQNVERLRAGYEAFNSGDLDTALRELHPDIELYVPETAMDAPRPVRGVDAVRRYLAPDAFAEQRFEPEEFIDHGNVVLVRGRAWVRGRGSGIGLEQTVFHVWEVREGKAGRLEVHLDRAQAEEAAEHAGSRHYGPQRRS